MPQGKVVLSDSAISLFSSPTRRSTTFEHIEEHGKMDEETVQSAILWYEIAGRILYYITLPIVKLLLLLFYVLHTIFSPFIHIAQVLVHTFLIPFNVAAKFEVGPARANFYSLLTSTGCLVLHWVRHPPWCFLSSSLARHIPNFRPSSKTRPQAKTKGPSCQGP